MVMPAAVDEPGDAGHVSAPLGVGGEVAVDPHEQQRVADPHDAGDDVDPAQQQAEPLPQRGLHALPASRRPQTAPTGTPLTLSPSPSRERGIRLGATAPSLIPGRCRGTRRSTLYYFNADRYAEELREG